jgi:hypothetical protein
MLAVHHQGEDSSAWNRERVSSSQTLVNIYAISQMAVTLEINMAPAENTRDGPHCSIVRDCTLSPSRLKVISLPFSLNAIKHCAIKL